jgi:hypothetical protein
MRKIHNRKRKYRYRCQYLDVDLSLCLHIILNLRHLSYQMGMGRCSIMDMDVVKDVIEIKSVRDF